MEVPADAMSHEIRSPHGRASIHEREACYMIKRMHFFHLSLRPLVQTGSHFYSPRTDAYPRSSYRRPLPSFVRHLSNIQHRASRPTHLRTVTPLGLRLLDSLLHISHTIWAKPVLGGQVDVVGARARRIALAELTENLLDELLEDAAGPFLVVDLAHFDGYSIAEIGLKV